MRCSSANIDFWRGRRVSRTLLTERTGRRVRTKEGGGSAVSRWDRFHNRLAITVAFVAPLVVAVVLAPLRGYFANSAAALTMVAVIELVAVVGNRSAGVIATLSAVVWFDYFLTTPYLRLTINRRPDIETAISLLVVGLFITELAARNRHHWRASNNALEYASMIHEVADLACGETPNSLIIERATESLVTILNLRSCRFDVVMAEPPLARIEASGEVVHVGMHWPVSDIGIPGPEAEIVARWRGRVVGRFVLTPTPGEPISSERRVVAVSLVNVVAASVMGDQHAS